MKVIKEKKGIATVIEVNGLRYVLEMQNRSKLDKAVSKKRREGEANENK
jgi:hypothetical protein